MQNTMMDYKAEVSRVCQLIFMPHVNKWNKIAAWKAEKIHSKTPTPRKHNYMRNGCDTESAQNEETHAISLLFIKLQFSHFDSLRFEMCLNVTFSTHLLPASFDVFSSMTQLCKRILGLTFDVCS